VLYREYIKEIQQIGREVAWWCQFSSQCVSYMASQRG